MSLLKQKVHEALSFGESAGLSLPRAFLGRWSRQPRRTLQGVDPRLWERLTRQRVFFGHQSVGQNILDGVAVLMPSNRRLRLNLVALEGDAEPPAGGILAHAEVGENKQPASKDRAFAGILRGGLGRDLDIAFYKYCYVDLDEGVDPAQVFSRYRAALAALAVDYPELTFVHVTVPLCRVEGGMRGRVKARLGRPLEDAAGNRVRCVYNDLLRRSFAGREPVFDLAAVESLRLDGTRQRFEEEGRSYPALVPDYAADEGHLNRWGRRLVAEALLIFLAELVARRAERRGRGAR